MDRMTEIAFYHFVKSMEMKGILFATDFRANAIIHALLVGIMGARDETFLRIKRYLPK